MNADSQTTEHQLRLATSRDWTADAKADAQTTADREAFLSFGAAVKAAAGDFDEAALVSQIQQSCLSSTTPATAAVTQPATRAGWWWVLVGGALAATLLLAMARIAWMPRTVSAPIELGPKVDRADKPVDDAPVAAAASLWYDPLDEELALAAATIEQLAARRSFDGSLWHMNQRLTALSQELSGESL